MDEQDWDDLGWLKSSENRQNVLQSLSKSPQTPKELSKSLDVHINHISNYLSEFKDRNLAKCVTPNRKKGRIYKLTEKGRDLSDKI